MRHELLDTPSARAQVGDGVGLVAIGVGIVHQAPSALILAADLQTPLVRHRNSLRSSTTLPRHKQSKAISREAKNAIRTARSSTTLGPTILAILAQRWWSVSFTTRHVTSNAPSRPELQSLLLLLREHKGHNRAGSRCGDEQSRKNRKPHLCPVDEVVRAARDPNREATNPVGEARHSAPLRRDGFTARTKKTRKTGSFL
jgi:hypothetical protein